ncbi:Inositol oxygenase [Sesbania bispinosa]|nr:Inositol oxygenase [Sesbania bispinosa]
MAILVEHIDLGSQFEEKNVHSEQTNDLLLSGGGFSHVSHNGFMVSEINSFGHSFRDYDAESERQKGVEEFYRLQHINQTYGFVSKVKRMREEYQKLNKAEMGIWECCELLNEVVDDSDPDLDEPQIQHLLQSAEAIRKDYPDEDWLHLTALIHDLGKILLLPKFGELPQWAVVGDTFPLGCAFDEANVHHKYFKDNPDSKCPAYSTKNGIYTEGCGLDNVTMSWGHDDYMYMVAKENGTTLPSAALFIIRYHSFYPLHKEGAYTHLMNEEDVENLKWLHIFNKYDLYSKSKVLIDVEKVKPYYQSLIEKVSISQQSLDGEPCRWQEIRDRGQGSEGGNFFNYSG